MTTDPTSPNSAKAPGPSTTGPSSADSSTAEPSATDSSVSAPPGPSANGRSLPVDGRGDGVTSTASAAAGAVDARPVPTTTRWQPLRLGLLNLYRFDHEEFRFAGGRLLLRGNNGTGKSRVLALTLPFLFDGEVSAHRLEPDGDTAKRIEWNLLLGRHDDRLGYTWIEFGRLDDGVPRYLTLGIGMRAVRGRGLAQKWLFTTNRRITTTTSPPNPQPNPPPNLPSSTSTDEPARPVLVTDHAMDEPPAGDDEPASDGHAAGPSDLSLVAAAGQALTRDRLRAALGDGGRVFDTAEAYRAEVDRRLFGLGEHRYAALVDLLIQLRRPQLSRQMDAEALSDALSEALPPVPRAIVGDVAEAFRTLEADRNQLASFVAATEATEAFMATYRRYAAVAVRRRAGGVTSTNSDYESTQRGLRQAESDRDEAEAELARLTDQRDRARDDERDFAQQVRVHEDSPEMKSARELQHARRAAGDAAARRDEAERERDEAAAVVEDRRARVDDAGGRAESSRREVVAVAARARDRAEPPGLVDDHDVAVDRLGLPDVTDRDELATARAAIDTAVSRRGDAVAHLRTLGVEVDRAERAVATARQRRDDTAGQLDGGRDAERVAGQAREQAVEAVLEAYRGWFVELVEMAPPAPDELAWELETWRDAAVDRSPLARAVDAAVADATRTLADLRATTAAARARLAEERDAAATERERVAASRHLPPPAPHTREPARRPTRPGAPLWQLVEPRGDLDAGDLAGFEAALEGAGLLDAWVTPDATVLAGDDLDVAIVTADVPPAPDGGLATVLAVAVDRDDEMADRLDDEVVHAVLGRIGHRAGAGTVWVSPDGRHRVGPLQGTWRKPAAQHLGHAAREQARRTTLAELDDELATLDRDLADVDARLAELEDRHGRLAAEHDAAPVDTPIRDAAARHVAAVRHVAELRQRHADADAALVRATADADRATAARDTAAADLGLADLVDVLDQLDHHLAEYRTALASVWPTIGAHVGILADVERATADHAAAAATHRRRLDLAATARDRARDAATRRDTLEADVGAAAEQVLARLEAARAARDAAIVRREGLEERRVEVGGHKTAAQQRMDDLAETLDEHARRRAEAVARLAAATDAGLLGVAHRDLPEVTADAPEGDWSADRGVRLARRIDRILADTGAGEAAWSRVQQGIHGHYAELEHALLPHDLHPSASLADDLFVVTAPFQGDTRTVPDLHDLLADEVTNRQALLTHRERQILHDHLIGDVAAHLHRLLRDGEDWVVEVNAELDAMPTSTGMKLRFAWRPRTELATFGAARRHLLGHQAGWTPDQRDEIGAFLQERIAQVREGDPTGTWQQHLDAALDYRGWHRFVVERHQDGEWTRLTRRSHGTGSGGEKALALTVPQFAAAAAHYRSADDHAPRLIMLDEAFVGIDASMRAKCLGLLDQFDLDLVMTSEREWGCYPTVPALAIAQLATRPGIDAVGVSRWVWNGRQRVRSEP